MPAKNNTNTTETKTKRAYNPTIGTFFPNDKFGDGSLLSVPMTAESFDNIQKAVQIGTKLLLKKSKKPASNGSATYFLEVLPALDTARRSNKQAANDDI